MCFGLPSDDQDHSLFRSSNFFKVHLDRPTFQEKLTISSGEA